MLKITECFVKIEKKKQVKSAHKCNKNHKKSILTNVLKILVKKIIKNYQKLAKK